MKAKNYREMSPDELESKLDELQSHLFVLKSQAVTEKIENTKIIKNTRREIARVKTIINEKNKKES